MHSFNELNLLDSIERRGLKLCYNEVYQITLWNRAKNPRVEFLYFLLSTQQKSIAYDLRLLVALGKNCLSKSSVLNLNIGLQDLFTWGHLLMQSLHFKKHWSFFSSCQDHPKLDIIRTLCAPKNFRVHVSQRVFPLNCFSLTCSTMAKTPSHTYSTDGMGHMKKWRDWLHSKGWL